MKLFAASHRESLESDFAGGHDDLSTATKRRSRGVSLSAPDRTGEIFQGVRAVALNDSSAVVQRIKIDSKVKDNATISEVEWRAHVQVLDLSGEAVNVRDDQYNFVVQDDVIYVAKGIGHPLIAQSHPVDYAGRLLIRHGKVVEWNNESGHYLPPEELNHQALLPLELFRTWQHYQENGWDALKPKELLPSTKERIDPSQFRPVKIEEQHEEPLLDQGGRRGRRKACPGCVIQ